MLTPEREFWRLVFLDRLWRRATYSMQDWDPAQPRRVEALKGACLALRREALDCVGLLDDSYFMYTEEVDLCHRLARGGWEVWWAPQAAVVHHGGASARQAPVEMYVQLYRSKTHFFRKFGGDAAAARYKRYLALAYGPRWAVAALGGIFWPRLRARRRLYRRFLSEIGRM